MWWTDCKWWGWRQGGHVSWRRLSEYSLREMLVVCLREAAVAMGTLTIERLSLKYLVD